MADPLVVVLPVHDEDATVADVIARVPTTVHGHRVQVLVVDDGSTDRSARAALDAGAEVLAHPVNQGLGAAVRTGLEAARQRGAWAAAFLDADGEYDPADLEALLEPLIAGEADYVVGSRFTGTIESMLPHRRAGNRVLTALTGAMAGVAITDGQSGFRALNRVALEHVEIVHDYNYAQVLTLGLLRQGMRYAEVPIRYHRRRHGRSFVKLGRYLWRVLPAMVSARSGRPLPWPWYRGEPRTAAGSLPAPVRSSPPPARG